MAKIELKGTVERVVRVNGKAEAQVLLTVPMAQIMNVPLGKVDIQLESTQGALFTGPMRGTESNIHPRKPKVKA